MNYGNIRVQDLREFDPSIARPASIGYERITSDEYRWNNERMGASFDHCIIQYTLSGHGHHESNGKITKLEKNTAFLASSENPFLYYYKADAPHWEFFWINIMGVMGQNLFHSIKKEFGPVVKLPDNNLTVQLFFELFRKTQNREWKSLYDLSAATYSFLMSLIQSIRTGKLSTDNTIEQAAQYMEQHLADNIDVKVVAPRFGYTREHFTRLFRQTTGTSPGNYLMNLRLEKAKQMLRLTSEKLESIAGACGFANANYLCRLFKKKFAVTPAEYKRTFDATIR